MSVPSRLTPLRAVVQPLSGGMPGYFRLYVTIWEGVGPGIVYAGHETFAAGLPLQRQLEALVQDLTELAGKQYGELLEVAVDLTSPHGDA